LVLIYLFALLFCTGMGVLGRLSGNGFGSKWGLSLLPELIHSIPYGIAGACVAGSTFDLNMWWQALIALSGVLISYGGMQSGTWYFLRWESHSNPNKKRKGTIKPLIDFIAKIFGYKIGDEGYAWIAAGVKGFIIGLPVGGVLTAIFWPLGYEIGSHAKGRVSFDPHAVGEFAAGFFGGVSICAFLFLAA
jgi:hypothetical protein